MRNNLYESASTAMLDEIISQAESLLAAQMQAAVAADQRALTFAGLLVAAVAALVGASASLGGSINLPLVLIATVLGLAAGAALWSAKPTVWSFVGNFPDEWQADIIGQIDLQQSRAEVASNYERRTNANARRMARAAISMRVSMALAALALFVALAWEWLALLT